MTEDTVYQTSSRRTFLKNAGAASATVVLAGCISEDDPVDSTPAETESQEQADDAADQERSQDEQFAITITQGQSPQSLDLHGTVDSPTLFTVSNGLERLLGRNRDGQMVGELATDWSRLSETRIRFAIRENVRFHNGDELTPTDVVYSIKRIIDDDVGGITSAVKPHLPGVINAEAVDGHAVEVELDYLSPAIFGQLSFFGHIMQEAWVESREPNDVKQGLNGTGPFKLEQYEEDVEVTLSKFDEYWEGAPAVDRVTFNSASEGSTRVSSVLAGESDVAVNVSPGDISRIEENEDARVEATQSVRVLFMPMRNDVEPFSSLAFRQAMNYAIDLESIIDNVLSGFGEMSAQPAINGHVGYNPDLEPYPYDPDRAAELVDESGFAGAEIEIHTPTGRYLGDTEIAQACAGFIDELPNVSCSVEFRDFGGLIEQLLDGDMSTSPKIFLLGWGSQPFDSILTLRPWFDQNEVWNHFLDDEIHDLIQDSENEADPAERERILQEVNALVHERAAWVFLNVEYGIYGVRNRVQWTPREDEKILVKEMLPSE